VPFAFRKIFVLVHEGKSHNSVKINGSEFSRFFAVVFTFQCNDIRSDYK
jgi:hypothetical protein